MPRSNHHQNIRQNLNTGWYWDLIQKPNGQYKLGWTAHYEGATKHRTGISTKTRIREIRSRWTAIDDTYIPPDPKYDKTPTPHEIRAQSARRSQGCKGRVVFFSEEIEDLSESLLEEDHLEELAGKEDTCKDTTRVISQEQGRYEISILDLPRREAHRKGKMAKTSSFDAGFEWVARKQGGRCNDEWEFESVGECEDWEEIGDSVEENEWEKLYDGAIEEGMPRKEGYDHNVRTRVFTYAEKAKGREE